MALSHAPYRTMLTAKLTSWLHRKARRLPEAWHEAALVLLRLDLDPARPMLRTLSAPSARGRPPCDPVCVRRAFLLMLLLPYKSLPQWADDLRTHPRLAQIAGFTPFPTPAVGTFYTFIDRLEDGPYAPPCAHHVRPSRLRKGRHRRHLKQEQARRHAAQVSEASQADTVTERLAQELLAAADQPRPHELLTRLADLLFTCGVLPSVQRGLLGDLQALVLCGDGATLPTGARPHGRPTCDCRAQGIFRCDHERFSSDATATWGYDAYRDTYFFGHRYFQPCVVTPEHTLPVHLLLAPGHVTDCTMGPTSLDRFLKTCAAHALPVTVRATVYDSGLDAHGTYQFLHAKTIAPVIALNPRRGEHPAPTGTATHVNDHGIPLCPAGLPMRRHSFGPGGRRIYYNGPVKRPTHRAGQGQWKAHVDECPRQVLCQPHTQLGPVVYVRTAAAPRLYPPIPRDSATFQELMATRSGCERSHSFKKVTSRLGERPCRSATQFLVRLALVSLLEHARAWLAEDRTQREEHTDGRVGLREAAEANAGSDRDAPSPATAGTGEVCPRPGNLPRRNAPLQASSQASHAHTSLRQRQTPRERPPPSLLLDTSGIQVFYLNTLNMIEHRAEFQTEAPMDGQEGIARDLGSYLAIAQDEVRQHGEYRFTRRALYPPDSDPTHTETDIMRVACETPAPVTAGLVCELKAKGEEESAHEFHKGLAVAQQLHIGRIVSKIDRDSAVFAGPFGCCPHVSPPGHEVSSVDKTRWGEHTAISRPL